VIDVSEGAHSVVRMGTSAARDLREQEAVHRAVLTDRVCWAAAGCGAAWLALYAVLTGLSAGSPTLEQFVGDGLYLVPIAATTVLALIAGRRVRGPHARMWRLLAASYLALLAGESTWTGYSYLTADGAPQPSAADGFYLLSALLLVPAVLIGFGGAGFLRQVRGLLDAALIMVGFGAVGWKVLISPQLDGPPDPAALTSAAYPLLDVVQLACLVAVGLAGHRMVPRSVQLVGWSLAAFALSDICYTYLVVVRSYDGSSWINMGWQAGAVLAGVAALIAIRHPESPARPQPLDRDLTLVPVLLSALATFALVMLDKVSSGTVHGSTLGVAGVMLGGLLVRQYLFTTDRTRLARQLQQAVVEQERLAVTDGLTGLYNRRFLLEMLRLEADRSARTRRPLSLVVIDLDHFKQVNDSLGHPAGDAVLVQAADRIRQVTRVTDIVARYGGEEFVVLLPDTDEEPALELAERIRRSLRRTPIAVPHGRDVTVTGSFGLATAAGDPLTGRIDTERLVADADRALYRAKLQGRDRTVVAGSSAAEAVPEVIDLPAAALLIADRIDAQLSDAEHSTAVQRWCLQVGRRMALSPAELGRVAAAGRLHDIGKASVDEYILGKAGPLTADERAQLRRHSEEGARLLRDLGRCGELAPLVEAHHERYDGTGYPRGLAGDDIPLEARIIAVCDTWAAMRVDRAYAAARPVPQARQEIVDGRGTQFDPQVADVFLELLDAGLIDDPQPLHTTAAQPAPTG
jgi:diguanylate cyclase (GGDEF)-like protein